MSKYENQENGVPEKKKPRGRPFEKGNKFGGNSKKYKEALSLTEYIKKKTNDGKALTNFYTGILKAVENSDTDNAPMYKGMKITAELSNKAVDWLGKNGWGNPSQRQPEPDQDNRTYDEKFKALEYNMKELGYKLVPIEREVNGQ